MVVPLGLFTKFSFVRGQDKVADLAHLYHPLWGDRCYDLLSDASGIVMSFDYCSRLADKCQEGDIFATFCPTFICGISLVLLCLWEV
jgi:hypothetical protein